MEQHSDRRSLRRKRSAGLVFYFLDLVSAYFFSVEKPDVSRPISFTVPLLTVTEGLSLTGYGTAKQHLPNLLTESGRLVGLM